jgi:hypothetical protein
MPLGAGGRVGRLVVLAACGLLVALAASLADPAVVPAKRGLVTGFIGGNELYSADPAVRATWLDQAVESRAGIVKIGVVWATIAGPQPPLDPSNPASASYNFSAIDRAVRDAEGRGFTVLLQVSKAPAWAEGPGRPQSAAPGTWKPNPSELADFMRAVTARFSGGFDPDGAGPAPRLPAVKALQVWNEPNIITSFTPQYEGQSAFSPGRYREMLNAAYAAVKAVDPKMLVVTAGTSPYGDPPGGIRFRPVDFWRQVFCVHEAKKKKTKGASKRVFVRTQNCPAPTRFDVLAHHPINTSGGAARSAINPDDASSADLDRIVRVLRGAESAGTVLPGPHPLWATEFWWRSNPPDPAGAPLARQARWIEQAMYLAWQDGASVMINLLIRDSTTPVGGAQATGIFFANGQPKPAYTAFRFPFVTERIDKRRLRAWGKAPSGGKLVIQRRARGRWVATKKIQVSQGSVFTAKLPLRGKQRLRAAVAGAQSLVWKQG